MRMANPTVEYCKKLIADAEMEILSLDALIVALPKDYENSAQLDSLRGLRQRFENTINKLQYSIQAIR